MPAEIHPVSRTQMFAQLVLHANYIAFYRVIDTSRTVEILRVKHVAQQTP